MIIPRKLNASLFLACLVLFAGHAAAQERCRPRYNTATPLPCVPMPRVKPTPTLRAFGDCPPEGTGDRSDEQLNRLKNRIDDNDGNFYFVEFDVLRDHPWPPAVEYKDREKWSETDREQVARAEGIPVMVEAYIYHAKLMGKEAPNCGKTEKEQKDHHIWVIKTPRTKRSQSIVVEFTPRVRARRTNWTTEMLNKIAKKRLPVRIYGWFMLDQEHPDDYRDGSRGTIWEIHPVIKVEVMQRGRWRLLDEITVLDVE